MSEVRFFRKNALLEILNSRWGVSVKRSHLIIVISENFMLFFITEHESVHLSLIRGFFLTLLKSNHNKEKQLIDFLQNKHLNCIFFDNKMNYINVRVYPLHPLFNLSLNELCFVPFFSESRINAT